MCFISTAEICTDTEHISCYNSSESGEDDQMVKDFPTQEITHVQSRPIAVYYDRSLLRYRSILQSQFTKMGDNKRGEMCA